MQIGIDGRHVLMTRFNLATPGRESAMRNRPGWLMERFDLFERYCLPSVAAQTEQSFEWIIYFDDRTPSEFRERIERCQAIRPFIAYFTPLFPAEGFARSARERVAPAPWLLTTRLDNDDAIATDFVARLHAAIETSPPVRGSINFRNGFVLNGDRLYAHTHDANPFFSWLEPWDADARTAPTIHHLRIAEEGPTTQIEGAGAWMQIVHGGNVSNRVRGVWTPVAAAAGRFPAAALAGARDPGPMDRMAETLLRAPLRRARDAAALLTQRVRGGPRAC